MLTPEPPLLSMAVRVTCTAAVYLPLEQAVALHDAVIVGLVVSIWTSCDLTASAPVGTGRRRCGRSGLHDLADRAPR